MFRRSAVVVAAVLSVLWLPNLAAAGGIPSAASNRDQLVTGWAAEIVLIALALAAVLLLWSRREAR